MYLTDVKGSPYGGQVAAADSDDRGDGVQQIDPLGLSQRRARLRHVRTYGVFPDGTIRRLL